MIEFEGAEPPTLPYKSKFQAPTSLDSLAEILSWFDRLQPDFVPRSVWLRCQLALAEGFTNAVRYAHQDSPQKQIDIEVNFLTQQIEIRVWDYGPPFDLEKKLQSLPTFPDRSAGGGRGLKLLQDIADELSYQRTADQRNCLLIVKYYEAVFPKKPT
ncbi:MAG: ATP-binding protein [Oscillatoriales cyanobacterium RM1_1_9]|nr:ATP-binding protein [Oscillatoriales cyanobacterium SM2_3_0]NJO46567.1 ATP-binding protein [Oscillatoriales cyanobacterium RM2_1_1]NJO71135.1 ATP-binding protein [Oscillatoriales cyanobacterium RM1_1_9]